MNVSGVELNMTGKNFYVGSGMFETHCIDTRDHPNQEHTLVSLLTRAVDAVSQHVLGEARASFAACRQPQWGVQSNHLQCCNLVAILSRCVGELT